ncbi:hypothetical protein [Paenisporosarcina cavernae]|uniref:Uncharacterized protein n=1 Tax=Paenisporosarcina cavernae TaxID=2320858 RepID=A0A385YUA9_9BACL|nr:hypothetical protein [Paenisporosarcina cavernae]AYC29890.1 hypothetical protein D3873_08275 [Paenisporosarcina cavernae]
MTEKQMEISDRTEIENVLKELNESRREGTQEMELAEGDSIIFETTAGKELHATLYSNGHTDLKGNYVRSNIQDYCTN